MFLFARDETPSNYVPHITFCCRPGTALINRQNGPQSSISTLKKHQVQRMSDFQVGDFRKICRFEKKHLSFLNDLERQRIMSSTHFYHQPTFDDLEPTQTWRPKSLWKEPISTLTNSCTFLVIGGFPCESGSKVRWKRTPHMSVYIGSLVKTASHQWWSSTLLLREWQTIRFGISFLSGVSLSHLKDAKKNKAI